jgi:glycosyltransferase involved in cell wall biosynthesis
MSRPLRIAIDASRTTVARATGTEHYALQLIGALIRLNNRHQITLYFRDQPPADLFPSAAHVRMQIIPFPRMWTHIRFASTLFLDRPDVTFVPAHSLPLFFPGRAVVTVHDLGYKVFPQAHPDQQRRYLEWSTQHSARRATLILADSLATATDLHQFYGTDSGKIRVVYPGVEAPVKGDVETVRHKYRLPEHYFLFIGTLQPRKNIARLVQAYKQFCAQHTGDSIALVLAGGQGWLYDPAWVEGVPGVQMLGYIDEADKGALLSGALALVFPSLYEGFGFPVLEAMHSGTPVLASRSSSLPELVGEAGLLVDPEDVNAIAAQMLRLAQDKPLRQKLRTLGYVQATQFTWARTAQQTLDVLEQAATQS